MCVFSCLYMRGWCVCKNTFNNAKRHTNVPPMFKCDCPFFFFFSLSERVSIERSNTARVMITRCLRYDIVIRERDMYTRVRPD